MERCRTGLRTGAIIKRATDENVELAYTTVSTVDLRVQLAEGFSSSYLPQLRPQVITHLRVKPGIDTVAISFRTTRPTIPVVELRESNGAFLEGRLPLLGGLQTRHTCVFGLDKPLAPNTKLNFRIEAFGPTLDPASPNKAVVTGEFMTGARIAEVFFESLDVLAYSDPGDGEFMFVFGVGNAETGSLLDTTFWPDLGTTDIGEDDSAVPLNQRTSLLPSPVRLWLQVMGTESDYAMPWDSRSIGSGLPLQFKGVGRKYEESGIAQRSTVTVIVDIGEEPGRRMIPFDMDTEDSPTHFTVSGHIAVHAFEGELISTKMIKSAKRPRRLAYLDEPGSIAHLGGADGGAVQTVALGSDGAMHCLRSRASDAKTDDGMWDRFELSGRGTPVTIARDSGTLEILDLDRGGSVLYARVGKRAEETKWTDLGGEFRHLVCLHTAGETADASDRVWVFGIAQDGSLSVRDLAAKRKAWTRLGKRNFRLVAPANIGRGALFAVVDNSEVVVFVKGQEDWAELASGVSVPANTRLVHAGETSGLGGKRQSDISAYLAALGEGQEVSIFSWPNFPDGAPKREWRKLGTLQELLFDDQRKRPSRPRRERAKA